MMSLNWLLSTLPRDVVVAVVALLLAEGANVDIAFLYADVLLTVIVVVCVIVGFLLVYLVVVNLLVVLLLIIIVPIHVGHEYFLPLLSSMLIMDSSCQCCR